MQLRNNWNDFMQLFKNTFREWWQVPRRAGERIEHRQVTFLELFYDLVYVVLIAQLAHSLSHHLNVTGIINFVFLFVIVWWAWFNGTSYHDTHGNNDIRTRFYTFLQMLFVVGMALFAQNAIGEGSVGFAISYALFQLTLTILWWRTGIHDLDHKPLSQPYSIVFLFNTILFAASIFFAEPLRYYIWGFAVLLSLLLPFVLLKQARVNPKAKAQWDIVRNISPSMVERFGLFTIIVLGEVVLGVVSGVSVDHGLSLTVVGTALLGTLIAIGIWWSYFDSVSHKIPKKEEIHFASWFYLHLPMTMGIAAAGAAILNALEHPGEIMQIEAHLLLLISLAIVLVCIALLTRTVNHPKEQMAYISKGRQKLIFSSALIILLGFVSLNSIYILTILVFLLFLPIVFSILEWMKLVDKKKE